MRTTLLLLALSLLFVGCPSAGSDDDDSSAGSDDDDSSDDDGWIDLE